MQHTNCIGWHCLTAAQKFGIIFSSVVTTIILLFAWMYYLGHVISSRQQHKQSELVELPGGRRQARDPGLPGGVVVGQLPVARQWPGCAASVSVQPGVFYFDDRATQVPRAAYWVNGPYGHMVRGPIQHTPVGFRQPWHLPGGVQVVPERNPTAQCELQPQPPLQQQPTPVLSPSLSPSSESDYQPRQLSWGQRLSRMLRLPTGRASTIASTASVTSRGNSRRSSARANSRRSSHPVNRQSEGRRRVPEPDPERQDERHDSVPSIMVQPPTGHVSPESVHSLESGIATVHSDDYDDPVQEQIQNPQISIQVVSADDKIVSREPTPTRSAMSSVPSFSSASVATEGAMSATKEAMPAVTNTWPALQGLSQGEKPGNDRATAYRRPQSLLTEQRTKKGSGATRRRSDAGKSGEATVLRAQSVRREREYARMRWDKRQSSASYKDDEGGPSMPLAIHQGGGEYGRQGGTT